MVVAGPGTGKTHILTLRIANILRQTDTPPDGILALTFTESGATTMRRRLADIIGSSAYRVRIHTFHGYCKDVIDRYPDEFPRIIGGEPISDIERIDVLSAIIIGKEWKHLKPFGNNLYYLHPVRGAISEMKRENISPDILGEYLFREEAVFQGKTDLYHDKGAHKGEMRGEYQALLKRIERTRELLEVYRAYEKELAIRHRYDFEDMIIEVVSAMEKDKNLLLRLQEASLYILADEHQDANAAQNRLLELLASFYENPNLFVVGDEKQAIYRFQGASLENFLYFRKQFPAARLVVLSESYRSGQAILDVSHDLASRSVVETSDGQSLKPMPLVSRSGAQAVVEFRQFERGEVERAWVAEEIHRLVDEGVEPSEIAVLYRTNGEAYNIANEIERCGLVVSIESDQNALTDTDVRKFLVLLRAIARFGDDESLFAVLHLPYVGIEPLDVYRIAQFAQRQQLLVAEVLKDRAKLREAGVEDQKAATALYTLLVRFARAEGSVPQILEELLQESGYLAYALKSRRSADILEKIGGLMRDAMVLTATDPDYTLKKLADHLGLLEEHRIPIGKENRLSTRRGAVRLMTAHRAKGLEFDYVFVINVADGVWGGRRETNLFAVPQGATRGTDEDERRLLYVALTRGRYGEFVSYARLSETGSERLRSRLLEDISDSLLAPVSTSEYEEKTAKRVPTSARAYGTAREQAYLRELFLEQGLSVTALNNFLKCPWQYFYSSLLRVPKAPNKEMVFGTAAHKALRRFFDSRGKRKTASKKQLITWFEEALNRAPISRGERAEARERGEKFLSGWYDAWHKVLPEKTMTEYKITAELPFLEASLKLLNAKKQPEYIKSIRLRGDLDRLDMLGETTVHVVDYKTGKVRSRNAILGKTKDESGPGYFRQLAFYKLLIDLEKRFTFISGEIDFLQPDTKGEYHRERFEISDADVVELRKNIETISKEIWEFSFWDRTCDRAECEYCALRRLMVAE